jgi:integrase
MPVHWRERKKGDRTYYFADITASGERQQYGLGADHQKARRRYRQLLDEIASTPDVSVRLTVSDLCERYAEQRLARKARSTREREMAIIESIERRLGSVHVIYLRPSDFEKWVQAVTQEPIVKRGPRLRRNRAGSDRPPAPDPDQPMITRQASTVNRYIQTAHSLMNFAIGQGYIRENPCKIKQKRIAAHRLRWLTRGEEQALLKHLSEHRPGLHALATVLLHTGLRLGEAIYLRWEDVDTEHQRLSICMHPDDGWQPKDKQIRYVPLNQTARTAIASLHRAGLHVFHAKSPRTAYVTLGVALRTAMSEAGIAEAGVHTLRHTFGTRLADAGVSPWAIAEIMGHSSTRTTEIYVHAVPGRAAEAVSRLDKTSGPG